MWRCWISPGDNPAPVRALMGPGPVAGLERNRVAPFANPPRLYRA
jgi:hypothetical protein